MTGDSRPHSLAGQGWPGNVLLTCSAAGLPLVWWLLRRPRRWGGLAVAAGCGVLFVRDVTLVAAGAPARLRPLPRLLLFVEVGVAGVAAFAGLWASALKPIPRRQPAGEGVDSIAIAHAEWQDRRSTALRQALQVPRAATAAALATFVLHTAREAIYLSPGHGAAKHAPRTDSDQR